MKNTKLFRFFYVCFMVLLSSWAQATSYTWNGSVSSAWSNPSNWTPNTGVPTATDDIVIVSAANVPQYNGVSGGCTNLTLTSGTLDLGGFGFTVGGNATFTAGTIQNGSFVVSGATTASFGATGPIVFDCPVSITAQTMALRNATFKNTATLTKTGSSNDGGVGNNTFMGATTINNSGSGYFLFGNTSPDNFQGAVTVNNTGSSSIHLAYGSLGNTFGSTLTMNQNSTGIGTGIVSLCRGGNSSATIAGVAIFNGNSTASGSTIDLGSGASSNLQFNSAVSISLASTGTGDHHAYIANTSGTAIFNGTFTYTNTSSGCTNSCLFITEGNSAGVATFNNDFISNNSSSATNDAYTRIVRGTVNFNGNIIVSNTATGAGTTGAYLCWSTSYTGMATLAAGKTVSIGAGGFSKGGLRFENFKQMGTTAQNISLTGTAALYSETNTVWNANVNFKSPQLYLNGATYNGTATLEKNGAGNAHGTGGNTFNGVTSITNSGTSGYLLTGGTNADNFNASTVVNNTSTGAVYFAYGHTGQTTTFGTDVTFNITKTASTASVWAFSVAEGISTNVVFQGAVNVNLNGGGVESDIRLGNGSSSNITFNDRFTFNNTNTNTNSDISLGINGAITYNQDVELSNTGGSPIVFNTGASGSSTLASGKKLIIGAAGYSAGILDIRRFTQLGSTAQTLTLTNTAILFLSSGSVWNGDVNFKAPQIYLNGSTYNGATVLEKTGATDNYGSGGNTFNGITTITNSGTGYLLTGSTSADVFNASTVFNNTGTHVIYVAHNHTGQTTTFAADVTFNSNRSASTGSTTAFAITEYSANITFNGTVTFNVMNTAESDVRLGNGASSITIFNGKVFVNNSNSHASTAVALVISGTGTFNEDIEITNTGGSYGTSFGYNYSMASCTLAAGKRIIVGSAGFNSGALEFRHFTQMGTTAQNITLTGTAALAVGYNSTFNGDVNFIAPQIYLHGCTYNGAATIEKNGAINNQSIGGNIFNGTTIITNSGTGYLLLATTNPEQFNASTTFNNIGSSTIYVAYNHSGTTTFASDVTFNSDRTSSAGSNNGFMIAESNANIIFGGTVTINVLNSARSDIRIGNGTTSNIVFNGKFIVNNSNTNSNTTIMVGINNIITFNDDIEVSNSGGSAGYIFNTNSSASSTLADGKVITIGAAGFNAGNLNFFRFTQIGNTPQTITLTGTATLLLNANNTWNGAVNFVAPQVYLAGTTFNAATIIEKNGATNNYANGGNTFNGVTTITNSGTGYLLIGGANADVFNAATTFNCTGTNSIYIAYSHPSQTTTFAADVVFNSNRSGSTGSTAAYQIVEGNANITFNGTVTFNVLGAARSDVRVGNTATSTAVFNGKLTVNSSNTNSVTGIAFSMNSSGTFNDNIEVSNTGLATITFGSTTVTSASTLANGKTVTIGAAGFTGGSLGFYRFTQIGSTAQAITLTGTAILTLGTGSTWNANVNFKAPQLFLTGTTYNGIATLEKTGATDNYANGGNIFNGITTITNSGSGYLLVGGANPDAFNMPTTFNNTGTSAIYVAYNHSGTTTFASDVIFNTNKTASTGSYAAYFITEGTANVTFNGTVTFNVLGSARSDVRVGNGTGTLSTFMGKVTVNNSNTNASTTINLPISGTAVFNDNIELTNIGGGIVPITFCNNASASATLANGKTITIGAAGFTGGTLGIYRFTQLGSTPQNLTLTSTATLTVATGSVWNGNVTFTAPNIYLNGATYNGTSIITKTTSSAYNSCNGGNIFVGVANIRNTGSGTLRMASNSPDIFTTDVTVDNAGTGGIDLAYNSAGNIFGGKLTVNNTTSGAGAGFSIAIGSGAIATFNGVVVINNTPSGNGSSFWLGHNGATTTFNSTVTLNHSATGIGSHELWVNSIGTGVYNGDVVFNNTSTGGSNSRMYIGESNNTATATFNGNFTFNNTSTATADTYLRILRGSVAFNGNINLINTATGTGANGFLVGWGGYNGNATLADTKLLTVGTFSTGVIRLYRFTQLGSTAQSVALTGNARLEIGVAGYGSTINGNLTCTTVDGTVLFGNSVFNGSVAVTTTGSVSYMNFATNTFNGAVTFVSPAYAFTNNTFNNTASFTKNGTANNDSNGGNVYNGVASFTLTSTGRLRLGSASADDYNANVTFIQNGTGLLQPAYTNASTFGGNISTVGSANAIIFGSNSGTVVLDGAADQTWNGDVAKAPSVGRLTISTSNNANLNLAVPVTVTGTLTLTSGLINTSATNLLIMANGSSASAGNALSYVNGIMKKIGNTAFTFPVGAGGYWARLGMIPVSGYATTTEFTCQYYASAPANNATASYMNAGITYASGVEYWDLKRVTAAGPTCQVTLYWENSVRSDLNPSAPSDLVVAHFSPATNKWSSQGGSPATISSAGSITSTSSLSSFSPITFGSITGQQPLPIQLLSFDAQVQNTNEVLVSWTTASQINNKLFVVERSTNGRDFDAIGTVQGAGNSRETLNYSFLDSKALSVTAYYRLKQIDFDGAFTYSQTVKVNRTKASFALYPNPLSKGHSLTVQWGVESLEPITMSVVDALGRVVIEKVLTTQANTEINELDILPEGVYVVRAKVGNETFTQKLIIQ